MPEILETSTPAFDKDARVGPAANSNNKLACDLYKKLIDELDADENLFFSPASISTALMLVYEGSRGETREQFDRLFGFQSVDSEDAHRAYARMIGGLAPDPEWDGYELDVANALWGEQTLPFNTDYLDTVKQYYEAGFASADFKDDPIGQRDRINAWVKEKTRGKIQGVLGENSITPDTRLVLANAMYFRGRWANEFWDRRTKDLPFYVKPNKPKDVPMMHQKEASYAYGKYDGYSAIKLWYDYSGIYMLVLLPDKRDGLSALEKKLSPKMLRATVDGMKAETVNLWLPKWETTSNAALADMLAELGLKNAFDARQADLSGISDSSGEPLFLSQVSHKAFIAVDEEGTEAAAVTVIEAEGEAEEGFEEPPKPIDFRADHPFVYFIRDRKTGAILFMGRVTDPS
ncbi:MAG: serpin family protein [Planctomycetota bacterium]